MKKILLALFLSTFLLSGCGTNDSDNSTSMEIEQPSKDTSNPEQTETPTHTERSEQMGEDAAQQGLSERIAVEISYAEEEEAKVEKKQEDAITQAEMNEAAGDMYQLWDDTLNVVWGLLEENLSEADMEVLRQEEREWIAARDAEVQAAGLENEGGSLQPLLEATKAAELTKARVYELAKYAEGR